MRGTLVMESHQIVNSTVTELPPPVELLDSQIHQNNEHPTDPGPSNRGLKDDREVNQAAVILASLSMICLLILIISLVVFLRKRRKSRKIYIPVTSNISRIESGNNSHGKTLDVTPGHSYLPDIYESLVTIEKETDDEDDAGELNKLHTSNNEGVDSKVSRNCRNSPHEPASCVPSRTSEPKHSRSLPSLKHLSAHEEALSYLVLNNHLQNAASNSAAQTKPAATSGVFGSFLHGENNFIRSRSFNERIAFSLNISRHSLSNKNRINVTNLNRCMTTLESGGKSKLKSKEGVKCRKQRNLRSSLIKSMRISNLVERIPSSFNIKKRLSSSVRRYRKGTEGSRLSPIPANRVIKSQSFCGKPHSINIEPGCSKELVNVDGNTNQGGSSTFSNFKISPSLPLNIDLERLFTTPTDPRRTNGDLSCRFTPNNHVTEKKLLHRSKSCVAVFAPPPEPHVNVLKCGNAISFDRLEDCNKQFIG